MWIDPCYMLLRISHFVLKLGRNSSFAALNNVSLPYSLSDRRGFKETGYYQGGSVDV